MPLPDLIEIVPLDKTVQAEITVPGSKSITNRALILAALAEGETTLQGALWSEDTQVMVDCLFKLGFEVRVEPDPAEPCNRTITVWGQGGIIPKGGTEQQPLELFVGNAGTAARFLSALVCLGSGVYRLSGVPRMHERPQAALFAALRQLGYRVESEAGNDKLPARIFANAPASGFRPRVSIGAEPARKTEGASCSVSIESSSQFASALLLCAEVGGWRVEIEGENADESPYVAMTTDLIRVFPRKGGVFPIEPDASSGSYFLAVGKLVETKCIERSDQFEVPVPTTLFSNVSVRNWPTSSWQIDQHFPDVFLAVRAGVDPAALESMRETLKRLGKQALDPFKGLRSGRSVSRKQDLGDSIMLAIVLAPFADQPVEFTDLGRLRLQECERVVALRTELTKCGAKVVEKGDTLIVSPSAKDLHGAEIETYNDHRMAMCFAILGLKVPGIKIRNPACVKKTFPNFFQKLAAPLPHGLGALIRDPRTGAALGIQDLFAE